MPDIDKKQVEPTGELLVVKWQVVEFDVNDDDEPVVRFHVELGGDPDHAGVFEMREGDCVKLQLRVVPQ